jgi:hypothetical protein
MKSRYNSVVKLPTLRAIHPTIRGLISCRGNIFFCLSNGSYGTAAHAASSTGDRGLSLSVRLPTQKPSTIKTKKAWSYTFSTYFYQTWCLLRVKMAHTLIVNIHTYCICLSALKVTNMATARNFEVIFDKLNIGIMFIWIANSSQKQIEVVVVVVVNKNTRKFLSCSFPPRKI